LHRVPADTRAPVPMPRAAEDAATPERADRAPALLAGEEAGEQMACARAPLRPRRPARDQAGSAERGGAHRGAPRGRPLLRCRPQPLVDDPPRLVVLALPLRLGALDATARALARLHPPASIPDEVAPVEFVPQHLADGVRCPRARAILLRSRARGGN